MLDEQQVSVLITHSDHRWTQLWVPGEEKPRRLFSIQSVAPGCLSLCRLHTGYHFTCKKDSVQSTQTATVEASPGSFEFFSLQKESSEFKCSAPEGLVVFKYSFTGRYLLGGIWVAHWRALSDICFADDGIVFVTASEDGTLKSWSLLQLTQLSLYSIHENRKPIPLATFRGHTMPVTNVCCEYGNFLQPSYLWVLVMERYIKYRFTCLSKEHSTQVTCLRWIPQHGERKGLLLSASEDQSIHVYDYTRHEMIQMYNKMLGKVSNMEIVEQASSHFTTTMMMNIDRWNIRLKRIPISSESTSELKSIWACYEPKKYVKSHEEVEEDKPYWMMKSDQRIEIQQLFKYYDHCIHERTINDGTWKKDHWKIE
ncbi:protein root initiation defective 3 [Galdieria sulphuraria]|nr:protein root initiation defective 3 [Galdieria sulphuraria]